LVDGQLPAAVAGPALDWVCQTAEGRRHWQACHIIGEVLRAGQASPPARDAEFLQRLQVRLQREPIPGVSPDASIVIAERPMPTLVAGTIRAEAAAANDALFRWRLIAGVAALGLVAVLGWQMGDEAGTRLAALQPVAQPATAPVVAADSGDPAAPPRMLRDPQLDALLAAHKQVGGASALQMPSGFLRNATFEGTGR
jgi:sigma-E factor negative regulatory protein RseA